MLHWLPLQAGVHVSNGWVHGQQLSPEQLLPQLSKQSLPHVVELQPGGQLPPVQPSPQLSRQFAAHSVDVHADDDPVDVIVWLEELQLPPLQA